MFTSRLGNLGISCSGEHPKKQLRYIFGSSGDNEVDSK